MHASEHLQYAGSNKATCNKAELLDTVHGTFHLSLPLSLTAPLLSLFPPAFRCLIPVVSDDHSVSFLPL